MKLPPNDPLIIGLTRAAVDAVPVLRQIVDDPQTRPRDAAAARAALVANDPRSGPQEAAAAQVALEKYLGPQEAEPRLSQRARRLLLTHHHQDG